MTTYQPSLFDTRSIDERFDAWLAANPHVFPRFCEIALEARRRGMRQWSADHLLAILRWREGPLAKDDGGFKANNDFTSRLARKAMAEVPELAGFFETRRLRT